MKLHRSLIFWAGIVVMGFIVWAWRDSRYYETMLRYRAWEVQHMRSVLQVFYRSGGPPRVIEEFTREPYDPDSIKPVQFPPPAFGGTGGGRVSTQLLRLPHAWLLGMVALVWSACLWRRWRRIRAT